MEATGLAPWSVTPMGQSPELDEVRRKTADEYLDGLFGETWVPDEDSGLEWVSVNTDTLQRAASEA